jgi:hypothetical protein
MSAFLTSLAQLGSQVGDASNEARQEKAAIAEKAQKMDVEQSYLQIARQAEARQEAEFNQRKLTGDIMELKDGTLWSISKGKPIPRPDTPNPMDSLKSVLATVSPAIRANIGSKIPALQQEFGHDPHSFIKSVLADVGEQQKEERTAAEREKEKKEASDQRRLDRIQTSVENERKWQEHRAEMEGFQRGMVRTRLEEKNLEPTADEKRRADLSENMNENLDQLEEIAKRRPDLFGSHGAGLITSIRGAVGTSDPDIAALKAIHEYLGLASLGAHSMRSAAQVGRAADAVMSGYRNSPQAMIHAIDIARHSIATFQADTERMKRTREYRGGGDPVSAPTGNAPSKGGPDPNDPLGVLK